MLALFEASGVIGAREGSESCLFQLFLKRLSQFLLSVGIATSPLVAGRANVAANEDVMSERSHTGFLK
jgi:hypothetical protein